MSDITGDNDPRYECEDRKAFCHTDSSETLPKDLLLSGRRKNSGGSNLSLVYSRDTDS
jgi:hypothetical protein